MTVATERRMTLSDYLNYSDGTDTRYELVNGALIPMSLGTGEHGDLSEFLNEEFKAEIKKNQRPWTSRDMKIGIQSPRGNRWDTVRIPDIVVLPLEQSEGLKKREAVIRLHEDPPLLVVEVVSPSTKQDDYRSKRSEYAVLNIPEYWIIDAIETRITICILQDGAYDDTIFRGDESLISPTFPGLDLTAQQVLTCRRKKTIALA